MVTETALVLVPQLVEQEPYMQVKTAMISLPARPQAHRTSSQDEGCEAGRNDISREGRYLEACFSRDTLLLILAMAGEFQEHRLG